MNNKLIILSVFFLLLISSTACTAPGDGPGTSERWTEISAVKDRLTRMVPATWTLDKYPDAETLKPFSKITLFNQKGPGVITLFHVSHYGQGDSSQLILRVWYDREQDPAIEMPLMDFIGDIEAATQPYSTIHFSHVRKSHNFRLPIPFKEHIRIEVENQIGRASCRERV